MASAATAWVLGRLDLARLKELVWRSRLLAFFFRIAAQRLIDRRFPVHLFLESTNRCNLRCVMCPRQTDPGKLGAMAPETFRKIVEEAAQYGHRTFCLHLFGEPLLSPYIVDMVRCIKAADARNTILLTTNGHPLSGEKAQRLLEVGVDRISVSLLAAEEQTYQSISGGAKLSHVERNILEFLRLRKERPGARTTVALRILRNERTDGEIAEFRAKWRDHDVELEVRNQHNYGGKIGGSWVEDRRKARRYPCYHLWYSPAVSWSGNVLLCCNDPREEVVLGNVQEASLAEIWQGPHLAEYRRAHLEGRYAEIPICADCDVWTMYPDVFHGWQKRPARGVPVADVRPGEARA